MAKKKKGKVKGGDARGYGQATLYREKVPPPKTDAAAAGNEHPKPSIGYSTDETSVLTRSTDQASAAIDEWDAAIMEDEKAVKELAGNRRATAPARKIPPQVSVKLPTLGGSKLSSTVVLSSTMHELLEDLVAPLPWTSFVNASTDGVEKNSYNNSDRFVKNIAFLYDYLLAAGFTWEKIRAAVEALGSGREDGTVMTVNLNTVLDWLCHKLSVAELPPRFLEDRDALLQEDDDAKRHQQRQQQQKDDNAVSGKNQQETLDEPIETTGKTEPQQESMPLDTRAAKDSDGVQRHPETEKKPSPINEVTGKPSETSDDGCAAKSPFVKLKEEERLEALEKMFAEVSLDYKDEAANYMRSKHEVKELEKHYNQLQKEVKNQKRKLEKARLKKQEEEQAAMADDEDEDQPMGAGLFDDEDDEDAQPATMASNNNGTASTEYNTAMPHIYVPDDAIPTGWTGKTPKETLEERCRNLKLSRPTFTKLNQNGCRIIINGSSRIEVEELASFDRKMDGQHYVATKALYKLDPTLPIYRSLPPFYSDLWKEWLNRRQLEDDERNKANDDQRREQVLGLLSCIQNRGASVVESGESTLDHSTDADVKEAETSEKNDISLRKENERLQSLFFARSRTKNYKAMFQQRTRLPIFEFRENILETVSRNPVTILCAETGGGKTTQLPQYILEHSLNAGVGGSTSILCTQPRRVAATSVAERVSEEMCTKLGDQVGYSIRLENRRSKQTRLLFCTTGVILRRLIEDPLLGGVSHVIVDEVHERQWQIDVLLVALRRLVSGPRQDLKVVLMSATLDAKLFCSFFFGAPLVNVPGRTFPVSNYFLEDLVEATGHIVEDDSPCAIRNHFKSETASLKVSSKGGRERRQIVSLDSEVDPDLTEEFAGYRLTTRRTMDRVDETVLNYDLIEDVLHLLLVETNVDHILKAPGDTKIDKGAVIIFLPGIGEIRTLSDRLHASNYFRDRKKFDIIPMHSALSSSEQRRAFLVPRQSQWAIIVATNIAETSVTIPDAVCVIDSGRVREVRHDKRTLTRKLVTTWCSRASTKQRAGRAGRVQEGLCLRLFSSRTAQRSMSPTSEPELQRLPLEEVCLTILAGELSSNGCAAFLGLTPQPPKHDAIQSALTSLEQVGAISVPSDDEDTTKSLPAVEKLTPLGLQLAKLPVDVRLGKMLLLSVQFRCVDTITTIVAGLSASQSPFLSFLRDEQAAKAKQAIFRHKDSDFLTLVNLYVAYIDAGETFRFCREHFVSLSALREIKEARKHYLSLLEGMGFMDNSRYHNVNGENEVVLHTVIAAALSQMARIDRTPVGKDTLWHRSIGTTDQQVHIHKSSVNATLPRRLPSRWIVFFEKFATSSRVSISMTAFCSPLALILLVGHNYQTQHAARRVLLDGWMEVGLAARTSVRVFALRSQILRDLQKEERLVDGVTALLKEDAANEALLEPAAIMR